MNAYGSSVTRVLAPRWRITVLPCKHDQMLWTILGMGKGEARRSFWNFSHPIPLLLLRRLSPYRHAFAASWAMPSNMRKFPRIPSYGKCPRHFKQRMRYWSFQGA